MSGGYSQQGYQARPPSSWGPPGAPQMQQPGYGYGQQGGYSGQSQYNMQQPPYQGYSQPASGGYASNWGDQSTAAANQPATQGSGYDYYSQQPTQQQPTPGGTAAAAGDNSGYNYSQQQASTYNQQGYSQDGYGGSYPPQSGYGQPPTYDQQGYTSAPNYGNAGAAQDGVNAYGSQGDSSQTVPPAQPSSVSQQGYGANQQPSPNPGSYPTNQSGYGMTAPSQTGYGNQTAAQTGYAAGYGAPQSQKQQPANPSAYGQSTQSPSTASGYGQPAAALPAGYSNSQPPTSGYTQSDSGSQRAPPSSYGTAAQPGFAPPSYGAPPTTQPGYGQAPPPSYSSYGAGYPQAAYSSDGNAGGATRGGYDSASAAQTAPQSGVAKASPKS